MTPMLVVAFLAVSCTFSRAKKVGLGRLTGGHAVVPLPLLAQRDQVGHQADRGVRRQQGDHGIEQGLLNRKADGAFGLLDPPQHRQDAITKANRQHQHLMPIVEFGLVHDQDQRPILGRQAENAIHGPRKSG